MEPFGTPLYREAPSLARKLQTGIVAKKIKMKYFKVDNHSNKIDPTYM
jgi:hypothetical protein